MMSPGEEMKPAQTNPLGQLHGPGRQAPALAAAIDHTLLKPDAQREEIVKLCDEARQHGFCSVCVNGSWVPLCAKLLAGSGVKVCTVVGFPLGACAPEVKLYETRLALDQGAAEIDMVINVGALKDNRREVVLDEIKALADLCHARGALLKVIIETCLLTREEKVRACEIAAEAGADFVKTSTGFAKGGATVEDIRLMRATVGPQMGVKASGGVRDTAAALAMLETGATRIGASASVAIVAGHAPAAGGY